MDLREEIATAICAAVEGEDYFVPRHCADLAADRILAIPEIASRTWQPMETAPKDESWLLLRCPDAESGYAIGFWSEEGCGWFESEADSNPLFNAPTGWAPLPTARPRGTAPDKIAPPARTS